MGKIVIPINNHKNGLHEGHKALIDFAKSFGGDTVVKVHKDTKEWGDYLLKGNPFSSVTSPYIKLLDDIDKKAAKAEITEWKTVPEKYRIRALDKANALVDLYKDSLLIDNYIQRAVIEIASMLVSPPITTGKIDGIIRGPELVGFFLQSVEKLIGRRDYYIYPQIIKNPNFKIKDQGSFDRVFPDYTPQLVRLHYVVEGAREFYKPGLNSDLVKELNISYLKRPWKVKDIAVFEGGLISGRMEVTQFEFPTHPGSIIIEEVDYNA